MAAVNFVMFGLKKKDPEHKPGLMGRLRAGLDKTRSALFYDLGDLFQGKTSVDEEMLEEIETRLLIADVGVESTATIIEGLKNAGKARQLNDENDLGSILKGIMLEILAPVERPFSIEPGGMKPCVILVVGVNGVGKTTSIGKMANYYKNTGAEVLLAAGDTFRAAAIEQIQAWGQRTNTPVIAQHSGADSAAVIFDALQSARSRNADLVIADTAGRLHNKDNLMEELHKIRRIINKFDADIPVEVMLVLDAGTGQNALNQAQQFNEIVGITGIALTKLDGTAKGGIVFTLAAKLAIPIRFIGIGEQIDDLRPFVAETFVDALLSTKE
jgi:fused signal recognition particle receptor